MACPSAEQQQRRPSAIAAGGFPLLGDYEITLTDVENQAKGLLQDPVRLAHVQSRFDPHAATAFYRDLATLAPDTLVDDLPCPLYCFWGDQDTDAAGMVMSNDQYMRGLSRRSIPFDVYADFDHEGLNDALEVTLLKATEWLLRQAREWDQEA